MTINTSSAFYVLTSCNSIQKLEEKPIVEFTCYSALSESISVTPLSFFDEELDILSSSVMSGGLSSVKLVSLIFKLHTRE